ncbi:PEP-CTERM sorting domain-containing protein [Dapis sp. BLCC M229]|uniref:PEP-CTERM sorting domain-containing protein n=1 Tax=Dapis sp. BLCC M229 TaxID=3400188 RepID=UPI003CE77264
MKTKLSIFFTAIVGGLISTMPAQAASFGNNGIMFDEDTEVKFDFLQSNGYWQAEFGVLNVGTGETEILLSEDYRADYAAGYTVDSENLGTAGISVLNTTSSFTFLAGQEYSLFVKNWDLNQKNEDGTKGGYIYQYSTTSLNPEWLLKSPKVSEDGDITIIENDFDPTLNGQLVNGQVRALFEPYEGDSINILFEDNTTWGNNDFDDFVVRATSETESFGGGILSESTPEPATLAGLGMVAGAMFLSRSRKKQK